MKQSLLAFVSTFALASCATSSTVVRQQEAVSQLDAGSVTVTRVSVIPWGSIVDELNPRLVSNGAMDHFNGVLPTSQRDINMRSRSTRAEFEVDLGSEGRDANGNATRTEATAPNINPDTPNPQTDTNTFPNNILTDDARIAGIDPQLRAYLATGVHQYLVTQNRYLEGAVDACSDRDAWLVRVSVNLQPYARRQPYDVYTRVFFANDTAVQAAGASDNRFASISTFEFVPLLVTDNMERSDSRQTQQILQQLEARLSGARPLFGFGGGVANEVRDLNQVLGSQFNNLVSITRPRQDMLEIRLGAAFSPVSRYEMQARSYDVHFLVIAPDAYLPDQSDNRIELRSLTTFRHAETGTELPVLAVSPSGEDALSRLADFSYDFMRANGHSLAAAETARADILTLPHRSIDDLNPLYRRITEPPRADTPPAGSGTATATAQTSVGGKPASSHHDFSHELFGAFNRINLAMEGSTDHLYLPRPRHAAPPFQTAVFEDDPASGMRVRLSGAGDVRAQDVAAALFVGNTPQQLQTAADSLAATARAEQVSQVSASNSELREPPLQALAQRAADRANLADRQPQAFFARRVRRTPEGELELFFPSLRALRLHNSARDLSLALDATGTTSCQRLAHHKSFDFEELEFYPLIQDHAASPDTPVITAPVSFTARPVLGTAPLTLAENATVGSAEFRVIIDIINGRSNPDLDSFEVTLEGGNLLSVHTATVGSDGVVANGDAMPLVLQRNAAQLPSGEGVYIFRVNGVSAGSQIKATIRGRDGETVIPQEIVELEVTANRG